MAATFGVKQGGSEQPANRLAHEQANDGPQRQGQADREDDPGGGAQGIWILARGLNTRFRLVASVKPQELYQFGVGIVPPPGAPTFDHGRFESRFNL